MPGLSPLPPNLISNTCRLVIPAGPLTLSEPHRTPLLEDGNRKGLDETLSYLLSVCVQMTQEETLCPHTSTQKGA